METVTVKFICNHTQTSFLNRNARNKRLSKSLCNQCEWREMESFEKKNKLPELIGTEHHIIKRARRIRFVKLTGQNADDWNKYDNCASTWIDNRNKWRKM
jgi:hypothetical protein